MRDWPEFGASRWVLRSVSGLFSNPPEAVWLPVMLRRFSRRNRSATRFVLPAGISVVTFLFPVGRVGFGAAARYRCVLELHRVFAAAGSDAPLGRRLGGAFDRRSCVEC